MMGIWDHFDKSELLFTHGDDRIEPPALTRNVSIDFKTPLPNGFIVTPVHTETIKEDDTLFMLSSDMCPSMRKKATKLRADFGKEVAKKQAFLEMVSESAKRFGIDEKKVPDSFDLCTELSDLAIQDVRHNPDPPIKPQEDLFKRLQRCYEVNIISKYEDRQVAQAVASNFMYDVLKKLDDKAQNPNNKIKYYLYAAHDSTLAPVLVLANQLNITCFKDDLLNNRFSNECTGFPDTASSIIFELVTLNREIFVRSLFNFEPFDLCGLKNADQKFRCPIKDFDAFWKKHLLPDWQKLCERPSRTEAFIRQIQSHPWKAVGITTLVLNILMVVGLIVSCLYIRKKNKQNLTYYDKVDIEDSQ